jgi:hypothetical protein
MCQRIYPQYACTHIGAYIGAHRCRHDRSTRSLLAQSVAATDVRIRLNANLCSSYSGVEWRLVEGNCPRCRTDEEELARMGLRYVYAGGE